MQTEVFHEGFLGKRNKFQSGESSLKKLFPVFLQPTEAKISLIYEKDNQTITKGFVSLVGYLSYSEDALNLPLIVKNILVLPKELSTSTLALSLTKIQAHALPDGGWAADGQDPMVIFTIGGKKQETARQKDAGSNALFGETFLFELSAGDLMKNGEVNELYKISYRCCKR